MYVTVSQCRDVMEHGRTQEKEELGLCCGRAALMVQELRTSRGRCYARAPSAQGTTHCDNVTDTITGRKAKRF